MFCGWTGLSSSGITKSVERLRVKPLAGPGQEDVGAPWEQLPASTFPASFAPRDYPVICPFGEAQILLMGGVDGKTSVEDAYVLDTRSLNCVEIGHGASYRGLFSLDDNSCASSAGQSKIIAPCHFQSKLSLIEYDCMTGTFTILKRL